MVEGENGDLNLRKTPAATKKEAEGCGAEAVREAVNPFETKKSN